MRDLSAVSVRALVGPLFWTSIITAAACVMAKNAGHGGLPLVITAGVLFCLTLPFLLFATRRNLNQQNNFSQLVESYCQSDRWLLGKMLAAFISLYLAYAFVTGCFVWEAFGRYIAFISIPTALAWWAGPGKGDGQIRWQDWLILFFVWIPFDSGWLTQVWRWPEGEGAYIINTALAVSMALVLMQGYRRHQGIKFQFALDAYDVRRIVLMLAGFLAIGLPIGLVTEFIGYVPQFEAGKAVGMFLGLLFFVGIPEELLFRGLAQNLLTQQTRRPHLSLWIAAIFFGATHLNNGEYPDWRYFLLATIAGLFYGWCFHRSRSIWVNAILHALVDTIWMLFFHIAKGGAA